MKKYREIKEVEAKQWFKDGDHEKVFKIKHNGNGENTCGYCNNKIKDHGCYSGFYAKLVCPGNWVVNTKVKGVGHIILTDKKFKKNYEEIIDYSDIDNRLKELERIVNIFRPIGVTDE